MLPLPPPIASAGAGAGASSAVAGPAAKEHEASRSPDARRTLPPPSAREKLTADPSGRCAAGDFDAGGGSGASTRYFELAAVDPVRAKA